MKSILLSLTLAAAIFCVGCASKGVAPFQSVNLNKDLDKSVLARYKQEAEKAVSANPDKHMLVLEKTDWRLLGLLAYWKKGTVKAMHDPSGDWSFMVAKTQGWGPLSILYNSEKHAMFSPSGELQSVMAMDSYGFGHLAMIHDMKWKTGEASWQDHKAMHLFHHILSISEMHGKKTFSLFSAPNPLSVGE